jgi:hypothetical protein
LLRGVHQGDPFSPLLFFSTADLLQSMVNLLFHNGDLHAPLLILGTDFPIVQYADDTLLIMQACLEQLCTLKNLLQDFTRAMGLCVNYSKSAMMSININDQELEQLAATFGCVIWTLPFTYLSLPLGTTRPSIQDLSPIVDQVERRLNASARFLRYGGRLEFVNSVLSSLPNHYLCSLKVHKMVVKSFDRSRCHYLWAKKEEDNSCNALAAWSVVCRPKKHGGLGIIARWMCRGSNWSGHFMIKVLRMLNLLADRFGGGTSLVLSMTIGVLPQYKLEMGSLLSFGRISGQMGIIYAINFRDFTHLL